MAQRKSGYEDIISLPHHVSAVRPPMSLWDRAAQFSPFAALTGHGEAITECARYTESRIEPAEDAKAELDERLRLLAENLDGFPEICVEYFVPDGKKSGGSYRLLCDRVKKLDEYGRLLICQGGTKIGLDDIIYIESNIFGRFPGEE